MSRGAQCQVPYCRRPALPEKDDDQLCPFHLAQQDGWEITDDEAEEA